MREVGKTSASGGKNKEDRLREAAKNYLKKARALVSKIEKELPLMPLRDTADFDVYCMI